MSRLLLVRHGETELNSAERYWGSTDVKLSQAGMRQAEKLRDRLARYPINAVYSSNLTRALTTAGIVASGRQLNVTTCAELREIDFGELEGLTFGEISQLYPETAELWRQRSPKLEYPGGEDIAEFNYRIGQFVERLKNHGEQETILVVAHSGPLRSLMCHLLDISLERRWQLHLELASLSILETYPEGAVLSLLNDISHLSGND